MVLFKFKCAHLSPQVELKHGLIIGLSRIWTDLWCLLHGNLVTLLQKVCLDHFFLTVLDCGGIHEGKKYFVQKYVAAKVNDFQPINLIIGMYKIISKVFANGTNVVMSSSSISKPQNTFVKEDKYWIRVLLPMNA